MAKNTSAPQSLSDLQAAAAAANDTPRHKFTFPPSLQKETGFVSVTMRELTGHDEIVATGASGASMGGGMASQVVGAANIAKELSQLSLVEVERVAGITKVDANNAAQVFTDMPPKIRNLVLGAYGEIHNPRGDEVEAFFASRSVRV